MNPVDKIVSFFNPSAGVQRRRDRMILSAVEKHEAQAFARDAARTNKHRNTTDHLLSHADSLGNSRERIHIIKEVRDLEENEPLVRSILRKIGTYTIGRLQYRARTGDDAADAAINAYVERWMAYADRTKRLHFRAMARVGVTSMVRDGDIGFVVSKVRRRTDNEIQEKVCPLRLQAVEADRIGGSMAHMPTTLPKPFRKLRKGEQVFGGVVVDEEGVPQRYLVYNRNSVLNSGGTGMEPWADIDAQDFILLHDPTRFDAYRGVSAFAAAVTTIKDMKEILGFERIGVKVLTTFSGIVNNAHGEPPDDVTLGAEEVNETGGYVSKLEPGTIRYLQQNETFNQMKMDRPSPTFSGFLETLIRFTGMTVNLPLGVCYEWTGTGPAVRMEAATAAREFEQVQQIVEEQFLTPLVRRVIAEGIKIGDLQGIPDSFDVGEWRYPAKVTIDAGRESKAMIDENMAGLISKTQIAMDRGEDPDMVRGFLKTEASNRIKDAKELVAISGDELTFAEALAMIERRYQSAPVVPPEPAEEPEDDEEPEPSANSIPEPPPPPQPQNQSFHINATLPSGGRKKVVTFTRDETGRPLSAEIIEE
jgi:capsid protein